MMSSDFGYIDNLDIEVKKVRERFDSGSCATNCICILGYFKFLFRAICGALESGDECDEKSNSWTTWFLFCWDAAKRLGAFETVVTRGGFNERNEKIITTGRNKQRFIYDRH